MVMKNGKIVGLKKKKLEAVLDNPKPKKSKVKTDSESKPKTKVKAAVKQTRKETSGPQPGYLQLGDNSFLTVELAEDDNGKQIVAFRKFYTTKNDKEKKPARGGFNMQPSSAELKLLAGLLRQMAKEIDGD